jgi:hypothetical protein
VNQRDDLFHAEIVLANRKVVSVGCVLQLREIRRGV